MSPSVSSTGNSQIGLAIRRIRCINLPILGLGQRAERVLEPDSPDCIQVGTVLYTARMNCRLGQGVGWCTGGAGAFFSRGGVDDDWRLVGRRGSLGRVIRRK